MEHFKPTLDVHDGPKRIEQILQKGGAIFSAFLGYNEEDRFHLDEDGYIVASKFMVVEEVEFAAPTTLHRDDARQVVNDLVRGSYEDGYTILGIAYQYGDHDSHVLWKDDRVRDSWFRTSL